MRYVIIDMKNQLFSDAIARSLCAYSADFIVELSEGPRRTLDLCRLIKPDVVLMEVGDGSPWCLTDRLMIVEALREEEPQCKVVLSVDEKADHQVAQKLVELKRQGVIDQFIYQTISTSYLSAIIDAL